MSTAIDTARYSFRVTWSAEDDEFVATCVEFPSLSWLAGTPELALSGLRNLVSDVVADLLASGEAVPEPLSTRQYSGKFQLRSARICTDAWPWKRQSSPPPDS